MHKPAAEVPVNDPDNPIVQIDREIFARIEEQQTRVGETARSLSAAAEEHKEAKKAHESALSTLTAWVAAMIRKVNGIPDHAPLPLFDNQTDAIAAAQADPIVQAFLNRLIDHGVTHLNLLVIAGYDEGQRHELETYLNALDARKVALAQPEGFEPLPEVVVPDFLVPQEPEPIADQHVVEALAHRNIVLKKKHIRLMNAEQRALVLAWDAKCHEVETRLGEAVTADDMPEVPSFVIKPKELEASTDTAEAADTGDTADTSHAVSARVKKPARAPRRSSKQFKNSPKLAGR